MNIDLGCYARDKVSGYSGYLTSWHMLYNGAIKIRQQNQLVAQLGACGVLGEF